MEDDGIATHQETMATTAGEPIELLQTKYVQFQCTTDQEVSLPVDLDVTPTPAPGARNAASPTWRKKLLKLPVSRQLQRSDYSVMFCSILLCFPIGIPGLWFLYKANKTAAAKEMHKSWRFFLVGRLLGRMGVVLGIIANLFALIGLFIAAG